MCVYMCGRTAFRQDEQEVSVFVYETPTHNIEIRRQRKTQDA